MAKSEPWVCPVCYTEPESYYGRLRFPGETEEPTCPNHRNADGTLIRVDLIPIVRERRLDR